jgi:hypothetical protein
MSLPLNLQMSQTTCLTPRRCGERYASKLSAFFIILPVLSSAHHAPLALGPLQERWTKITIDCRIVLCVARAIPQQNVPNGCAGNLKAVCFLSFQNQPDSVAEDFRFSKSAVCRKLPYLA